MKLSLPIRIFVFHLIFMVALGALSVLLVRRTFERYRAEWERELRTAPAEELFSPLVSEVARSMLLRLEGGTTELRSAVRESVGNSLDHVLPTVPSIDRLVIVDERQDVQYADDPTTVQMLLAGAEYPELLAARDPVSRRVHAPTGEEVVEVLIPVHDDTDGTSTHLGAALVHYRPSANLDARLAEQYGERFSGDRENWLDPWVGEVARYVLRETRLDPAERVESDKQSVSEGLNKIIEALPMETLVIVDQDRRIQYVNDPRYLDLEYVGPDSHELFAATEPVRQVVDSPDGERMVKIMLPVFEEERSPEGAALGRRRLGSVMVQFRPDPELLSRLPSLRPSTVGLRDYLQPLSLFFVVAMGGGILLAALTGLPVRRVERALRRYRERGFKGGLDEAGLPSDLANTMKTISELGGRLEALDAKGREREALLETLSHTLEDGMLAVDPSGNPVSWNPVALRILVGVESVPEGEDTSEREMLQLALARNEDLRFAIERIQLRLSRELELRLADGTTSLVRLTQVPIELPDGVTGTLVLLRDLAALRKIETHLLDTGRFAVLTHLGASLAHEIRNPLHAIQLNTSVVQEYANRAGRSGPVSDSLNTIKEETQRLTDLLNNYLGLVRTGDDFGPVDLRNLAKKVIGLVDYLARQSKVKIDLEGESYPPTIQGVPGRLQQAILNLVLNAIQAMPGGGTLTVRVESSAGMVRLTVSDTGPGLPHERADQLFDTRVTTKPEGSGLGLPLVRLIAEAHGGGVWYRSQPGEGTAFTLAFPLPVAVV